MSGIGSDTDHAAGCRGGQSRRDVTEEHMGLKIMTEYNSAEIYDRPVKHMSVKGIFRYAGVDMIPWDGGNIGIGG